MLLSFVWALSGFRGSSARLLCALLGFEVLRSIFLVRIRRVCHTSASLWGSRFVAVRCLRVSVCVVLGFVFFEFCSPTALLGCFAPRLAVPPCVVWRFGLFRPSCLSGLSNISRGLLCFLCVALGFGFWPSMVLTVARSRIQGLPCWLCVVL